MDQETLKIVFFAVSVVFAFLSVGGSGVALLLNLQIKKRLDRAKDRETYTVCPHCSKHIPLSDLAFYLPSGELDNDLDGKKD